MVLPLRNNVRMRSANQVLWQPLGLLVPIVTSERVFTVATPCACALPDSLLRTFSSSTSATCLRVVAHPISIFGSQHRFIAHCFAHSHQNQQILHIPVRSHACLAFQVVLQSTSSLRNALHMLTTPTNVYVWRCHSCLSHSECFAALTNTHNMSVHLNTTHFSVDDIQCWHVHNQHI